MWYRRALVKHPTAVERQAVQAEFDRIRSLLGFLSDWAAGAGLRELVIRHTGGKDPQSQGKKQTNKNTTSLDTRVENNQNNNHDNNDGYLHGAHLPY